MSTFRTIAVMISVGDRGHLTDITFPRLSKWAERHGYNSILVKENYEHLDKQPHFNKLVAHKIVPGYDRYIIVDDDLVLKAGAPAMEAVPPGFVGLCRDAVQTNTEAPYVKWAANTGFIVADSSALYLLEEAYQAGIYPHQSGDGSGLGIWGPFDQGTLNNVLFRANKIHELDWRWNYQAVIDYYGKGKGWDTWRTSRLYRLNYYLSLWLPFSRARRRLKEAHGLHMTMGPYPKYFALLHQ